MGRSERIVLTSSEIGTWKACPRKWWFKYHEGLEPLKPKPAPYFGSLVHVGLGAHYGGQDPFEAMQEHLTSNTSPWGDDEAEHNIGIAEVLVGGLLARDPVRAMEHEVVAVEKEFIVPLKTATGRKSPKFSLAGKIDLVTKDPHGNAWLWDWKTGSRELDTDRLQIDDQMAYYMWAQWQLGLKPIGIIYYLIRKPQIRIRKNEDSDAYFKRLSVEVGLTAPFNGTQPRPEWYYQKSAIVKSPRDLDQIGKELIAIARTIGKGATWRNPDACRYHGCVYRELCLSDSKLARKAGFKQTRKHSELQEVITW